MSSLEREASLAFLEVVVLATPESEVVSNDMDRYVVGHSAQQWQLLSMTLLRALIVNWHEAMLDDNQITRYSCKRLNLWLWPLERTGHWFEVS